MAYTTYKLKELMKNLCVICGQTDQYDESIDKFSSINHRKQA